MALPSGNWSLDGRVGLSREHHPRARLSVAHRRRSAPRGDRLGDRDRHALGLLGRALGMNTSGGSGGGEVGLRLVAAEVLAGPMGSSGAGTTS